MKLASKITVYVDGAKIPMENGAKFAPGGVTRKPERHGGRTYHTGEEVPPRVIGTVLHTKDTDIIGLSNIEGATVMITDDVGHKYVMTDAYTQDVLELDGSTGKSTLTLFGDQFEPV
ncbi:MAG: phage tail tube protein [Pseudomonadota bacterium]